MNQIFRMGPVPTPDHYARDVVKEIMKLRGYRNTGRCPVEVVNDIFHTMDRWEDTFHKGFQRNTDPKIVARDIQYAEWDAS